MEQKRAEMSTSDKPVALALKILPHVILCATVVDIIANVSTALVLICSRILLSKKANVIILNILVLSIMLLATTQVIQETYDEFSTVLLFLSGILVALYVSLILVIMLLVVYWYIQLYHTNYINKVDKNLNLILSTIYITLVAFVGLFTCFHVQNYFVIILMPVYTLFMITVDIIHFMNKNKISEYGMEKDYCFILSNVCFISILPSNLVAVCSYFGIHFRVETNISVIFMYLLIIITSIRGVYIFITLYKCNEEFKQEFNNIITGKCCRRNNESEIMNFSQQIQ